MTVTFDDGSCTDTMSPLKDVAVSFTIPECIFTPPLGKQFKGWVMNKQTTQTTGYQIQYATKSNFKGGKTVLVNKNKTTSKTISKLKANKKYYVRIRTYKTIKGVKYYGNWSGRKSAKTK